MVFVFKIINLCRELHGYGYLTEMVQDTEMVLLDKLSEELNEVYERVGSILEVQI